MQQEQFLTKNKFTKLVEDNVKKHRYTYMDAIIHLCEDIDLDLQDIRKYVSTNLKEKVEAEAMELNYLPKLNTLPLG